MALYYKVLTGTTDGVCVRLGIIVRVAVVLVRVPRVLGIVAVRGGRPVIAIGVWWLPLLIMPHLRRGGQSPFILKCALPNALGVYLGILEIRPLEENYRRLEAISALWAKVTF